MAAPAQGGRTHPAPRGAGGTTSLRAPPGIPVGRSTARALAAAARPPGTWLARVLVREVPCSGKMDGQYLLHAMEGRGRGLCVVACPKGECHLAQGNYRAETR